MKGTAQTAIQGEIKAANEAELEITTDLEPLSAFAPPMTIEALLSQGGSEIGHSTVAGFLMCPEYSRLRAIGVQLRKLGSYESAQLGPAEYGTLIHALLAVRAVWSMADAMDYLAMLERNGLGAADAMLARNLMLTYDLAWPKENEPFEYLAVEATVRTNVGGRNGERLIRTVRYDAAVRFKQSGEIYSLEHKTASRSGEGGMEGYRTQSWVQKVLWNRNEALVAKYGPMSGVIFDCLFKTQIPSVDRYGPGGRWLITKRHEVLALDWLRLPEEISYPVAPDGAYSRMLQSCSGKYRPCEYKPLCHDNEQGLYEIEGDESGDTVVESAEAAA